MELNLNRNPFAIVDATGEIVRIIRLSNPENAKDLVGAGQTLVEQAPPNSNCYWVPGADEATPGRWVEKPASPSPSYSWNVTTKAWVDARDIEVLRASKLMQVNSAKARANGATFTYGGKAIACDAAGFADLTSVAQEIAFTNVMPTNWPGTWTAKDNTTVPIANKAAFVAMFKAMVDQRRANFAKGKALKDAIKAATTTAQLDAISLDF